MNARRMLARLALVGLLAAVPAGPASGREKIESLSSEEAYRRAEKLLEKGSYYKARMILEKLIKRPGLDPSLAADVQLGLADAYFGKSGMLNLAEALSRYSNFLVFYPTHEKADYAQYRLALCHFQQVYAADRDQRETITALEEFRKVQLHYPDSPYVDLAAEKIQESRNLLAEHEYKVGFFYYRRKAYLGAIDRFEVVLDRFPRYERKDRLYYYLGDSLRLSNRPEEADVYLRKLVETYPDSDYVRKADVILKEIGGA